MKTKKWVIIVLAIFIAITGFATEIPKMNVISTKAEKTRVSFESDIACPIELTIKCDDGTILYYWKSKTPKEKLDQVFDLSDVKCGKYKICLNYGEQTMFRELSVTRNGIYTGPNVQLHQPFFSYSDNKLKLSLLNTGKEDVCLNIYKNGNYITGISLGNQLDLQKLVDLSNLENGDYDVVLSDSFSTYHYMVHK